MTIRPYVFVMVGMMTQPGLHAQSLSDARSLGLAAYSTSVNDGRGYLANPAGLVDMRDWSFNTTTNLLTAGKTRGFVFQGFSLARRFLENHAVVVQYSPGTSLEFVFPTSLVLGSGGEPVSFDKRVSYDEHFSFGYAYRPLTELSVGVSTRSRKSTITDSQLSTQDTVFVVSFTEHEATSWNLDAGVLWKPTDDIAVSVTVTNIVQLRESKFPQSLEDLALPGNTYAGIGGAYRPGVSLRITGDMTTAGQGGLGCEWYGPYNFMVRAGVFLDTKEAPVAHAVAVGAGWSYEFLEVNAGYLHFLNQDSRKGSTSLNQFDPDVIKSIELNRYTPDRLALSVRAVFGNVRESLARIESVEMAGAIFPAAYQSMAYRPVGKTRVRNISGKPVHAKARFFIEGYMDAPTESQPVYLMPGEENEIPLTAVFNDRIMGVSQLTIREGTVYLNATPADDFDDKRNTTVLIHSRNAWDGDVNSLRYFVTPDDPAILRYTRDILLQHKDSLQGVPKDLEPFNKARILIDTFAGKLLYLHDPKQTADYVQYPSETLQLRGGDCDDMTVYFSSLLNSIGISTAFVSVVPPDQPDNGHIFLLFDTGLAPQFGVNISENPKRFVIRRNPKNIETIWIPIETTVTTKGFDAAWSTAAEEYFNDVEVRLGLVKGWVEIVDVY